MGYLSAVSGFLEAADKLSTSVLVKDFVQVLLNGRYGVGAGTTLIKSARKVGGQFLSLCNKQSTNPAGLGRLAFPPLLLDLALAGNLDERPPMTDVRAVDTGPAPFV